MTDLEILQPIARATVLELAREAGIDVSDWQNVKGGAANASRNPKYCYEWAMVEPGSLALFNLWFAELTVSDGVIVREGNYREDADFHRDNGTKFLWERRARKADDILKQALREGLPLRAIINAGVRRRRGDRNAQASQVKHRLLDPEPWSIAHYDWQTGAHVLARGNPRPLYVDQFSLPSPVAEAPERRVRSGEVVVRRPGMRDAVLARAGGRCEHCGAEGFPTPYGLYLETHHIEPLGEGGLDIPENMIALCPNDHRRAHFGVDRLGLRMAFQAIVAELCDPRRAPGRRASDR